jgi:hypothetical protein
MQSSIEMIIEEVKRLSNLYENRVPSVLLFETLFKAKEMHKQEIEDAFQDGKWDWSEHINNGTESKDLAQYYQETFKKD